MVEDLDFFLRLSEVEEMANLPDYFCVYRLHDMQVTAEPSARYRLEVFLTAVSAIEQRRGREEYIPDDRDLSELAVSKMGQWLSDSEMTWKSLSHGLALRWV